MVPERDARLNLQTIQLRAFAAIAEEGSYTRVARQLSYTEPAVNMQIKSLERAVGLPLVHREGKRVLLTPAGQRLLPMVHDILERNLALERTIRAMQPSSRLVIGAGRHTGVFLLVPLLAEYRRMTGDEPELHFLPAAELASGIVSGRFDLVVAGIADTVLPRSERLRNGIVRVPWQPVDWALIAEPSLLSRWRPSQRAAPTTVFFPDYALRLKERVAEVCQPYFAEARLSPMETAEAVKAAVVNGLGVGLLPLAAVQSELATGALAAIEMRNFQPTRAHVLHRRGDPLKPQARRLVGYLLAAAREKRHARVLNAAARTESLLPRRLPGGFTPAVRSPADVAP